MGNYDDRPPTPYFILRGHTSEVQCLDFCPFPSLQVEDAATIRILVSGDADGFVFIWSLVSLRPIASWHAHAGALLSVSVIDNCIYTHGRDNKLYGWKILNWQDIADLNSIAKTSSAPNNMKPFMLFALDVNALNFCQASLYATSISTLTGESEVLVAVPGLLGNEYIDIYTVPSSLRLATRLQAPAPEKGKLGNVMSLDMKYPLLLAGYENGAVALFEVDLLHVDRSTQKQDGKWKCLATWTSHREAVLSVVLDVVNKRAYSCGIDSRLICHTILAEGQPPALIPGVTKVVDTKHSGQQSLRLRSDGKVLGSAGWDSFGRLYSASKMKQIAVLKSHKLAINAIAFQKVEAGHENVVALGSKDGKISLWRIF